MSLTTRRLVAGDETLLDEFLKPHTAQAYYLRSNMLTVGLAYEGKFLQGEYIGAFDGPALVGVASYSWLCTLLVFASDPACLPVLAQAVRPLISQRGGKLEAILGMRSYVEPMIAALNIPRESFRRWGDTDGLFAVPVSDLNVPARAAELTLRKAEKRDRDMLVAWCVDFEVEALRATHSAELEEKKAKTVDERMETQEYYILEKEGQPVSMCTLTNGVPDVALVGGVWTPVDQRCKGYARAMVALSLRHLAAHNPALQMAILTATRPDAIRAYEAIGFARQGDWLLALIKEDYRLAS